MILLKIYTKIKLTFAIYNLQYLSAGIVFISLSLIYIHVYIYCPSM